MFREEDLQVPIHSIGVPLEFIEHSKRSEILSDLGITSQNITQKLVAWSSSDKDDFTSEAKQLQVDENENQKPSR